MTYLGTATSSLSLDKNAPANIDWMVTAGGTLRMREAPGSDGLHKQAEHGELHDRRRVKHSARRAYLCQAQIERAGDRCRSYGC